MRAIPLLLFLVCLPVLAEDRVTTDFADVEAAAGELFKKHGAKNVLIVLDIDNTLLTMNQDFGGDAWFNWQAALLKSEPKSPQLVAKDFAGLLRVQGILFALSGMRPPENSTPAAVKRLQASGASVMAMTSRGPEFRSATMRVLKQNGYSFGRGAPYGYPGTWLPAPADLTIKEQQKYGFIGPRRVSYMDGVFLASGQHKGGLLRMLIHLRKLKYKAILFVDDHAKHTARVTEAWTGRKMELITIRYARMDTQVARFGKSDKQLVSAQWAALKATLGSIFG